MAEQVKLVKTVKLWNRGDSDYKQMVMGDEIYIPKGGHIVTGRRKAIDIKGHCTGKHTPASLEIEPIYEMGKVEEVYVDHKTGNVYPTKDALMKAMGIDPKTVEAARNQPKYMCVVCDKQFDKKDDLITHMKVCMEKVQPTKKQ